MNFPEKLKALRKEKGFTQAELARKIFVSRSLIARFENGSVLPTRETLEKLSLLFGVDFHDLLDDTDVVELTLFQNRLSNLINQIFSYVIILVNCIFSLVAVIPIFKINRHNFPNDSTAHYYSLIEITLLNKNPIILITIILGVLHMISAIIVLVKTESKSTLWLRIINYLVFIIILFLIFFSTIFAVMYLNNNMFDY